MEIPKNAIKESQNVFNFLYNCILSGSCDLPGHKYTWLKVNVLYNNDCMENGLGRLNAGYLRQVFIL